MFDAKVIASNIKRHRMMNRLTQSKLADLVSVSVQAVSKWECGVALPDLSKLYVLAELFSVSVDELLGRTMEKKTRKMMIGIAGSGFATEFILFDDGGNILGRRVLDACTPSYYGMDKCCEILKTGIDSLAGIFTHQVSGAFIGLACNEKGDNISKIIEFLKQFYPGMQIMIRSNIQNVIACFPELKKAAFVICDTSALLCARQENEIHRFCGLGYLLEDGGSILAIGKDALSVVLLAEQGVGEPTVLTEYVTAHFGKPLEQCVNQVYWSDITALADFAPYVFEAYRRGDKEAERILEKNMEYIVRLIQQVEEKYNCDNTVVLSSCLHTYADSMIEILERKGLKGHRFYVPEFPQIYGACLRCAELCGIDDESFRENFKINYQIFAETAE